MAHIIGSRTTLAAACFAAVALACSDDPSGDASADASSDAGDAADASGPEDVGVPDVGACGCTFGFHQSCASNEVCVEAFSGEAVCTPTEPNNGCVATSTPGVSAPCNAQCATANYDVSPCMGMGTGAIEGNIREWFTAIENARSTPQPGGWERMRPEDIEEARNSTALSSECREFLGWTVLGLVELCRGSDTVRHFEPWGAVENISFKYLESPRDECIIGAGNACAVALRTGAIVAIDQIPGFCGPSLPYGAPCNGSDAQACLRARVASIIRVVHNE
jgi:hypothetical protein